MRLLDVGGLRVRFSLEGPAPAPVLVFSHSLGSDLTMWDEQAAALAGRLRVLRYDTRGHGGTPVTPGPYTIDGLGRDVIGLLDALAIDRAHFCGLSLGGLIGMWLGAHAPERVEKLVLCNTGAVIGTAERWNARIRDVRDGGMKAIAASVIERWFTPEFRQRSPPAVARAQSILEATPADAYVACCIAIRDSDEREDLGRIQAPTLVVAGRHDPATPPADLRAIARAIRGCRYVELEASHLSNVEAAAAFTAELQAFLAG